MKTNIKKAFFKITLLFCCLCGHIVHAAPPDPCPGGPPCQPPPDAAPISDNIIILFITALLFGTYILYNHKLNKKRPI